MLHKEIPVGDRHAAHSFEYADAAARIAATGFVSTDIHKFGLQLDNGSYWRLASISPITWAEFGAKGADGEPGPQGDPGIQGPPGASGTGTGDMLKSENLSGLANTATARTNIGLGNVDNTADTNKPVSTAQATAIAAKEPTITAGTAAQYWKGTKSWSDLATDVRAIVLTGLSLATGTAVVATDTILAAFGKLQKQIADLTTAVGTKAPTDSPTFTGTVSGISATMVGLGSVNNTSDTAKPISTATQTALDGKSGTSHTHTGTYEPADATILKSANIGASVQAYDAQLSSLIRQNSQSTAYTCVLTDGGKHLLHPSADTTARVFTIPANSSVAYPIGTAITFVNQAAAGVITISITTDTMRLAGAGTTGSRTLAANGIATALKITPTEWIISGTGLS